MKPGPYEAHDRHEGVGRVAITDRRPQVRPDEGGRDQKRNEEHDDHEPRHLVVHLPHDILRQQPKGRGNQQKHDHRHQKHRHAHSQRQQGNGDQAQLRSAPIAVSTVAARATVAASAHVANRPAARQALAARFCVVRFAKTVGHHVLDALMAPAAHILQPAEQVTVPKAQAVGTIGTIASPTIGIASISHLCIDSSIRSERCGQMLLHTRSQHPQQTSRV